jgi:hypothetical protein
MSQRDNATNITNPDFVLESARPPYTTPLGLIRQTEIINEVVVIGTKNRRKVKISGVGIKLTDCEETIRVPEEAERMREIAEEMKVPVIELTTYSRIQDSEAEVNYGFPEHVRSVYINRDGHRYCFEGEWKRSKLKEVLKGDKHFYGGHNPVSKKEYLGLRPDIKVKLSTETDLDFLRQIDRWFGLRFPVSDYSRQG